MQDPLLSENAQTRGEQRNKRLVWVVVLVAVLVGGLFAVITYRPREHTYSIEVPVEIISGDEEGEKVPPSP